MTLGQRIQELRRQNNLSQEALGDRLGVSRQAISKWESDTTIPEVDKLIAMSRQFGVNVGVLLGVEEPAQTQEPAGGEQSGPPELSDRELAAVELIVSRYIEQMEAVHPQPEPREHRLSTGWKRVIAVAAVLAVIAAVKTATALNERIEDLNRQTANVRNQMISVENNVTNQIYNLSNRLEKLLEEQGSLLLEQSCTLVDYIPGEGGLFSLSARPKEYIPGLKAVFYAESADGQTVSQPALLEGDRFYAELWVPLWDNPSFRVELDNGQSLKRQPIRPDQTYMLQSDCGLLVPHSGFWGNWELSRDNTLTLDFVLDFGLEGRTPGGVNADLLQPQELTLRATFAGQEFWGRTLDVTGPDPEGNRSDFRVDLKGEWPVTGPGTLEVWLTGRDNYGQKISWQLVRKGIAYGQNEDGWFESTGYTTDLDALRQVSGAVS